MASLLSSASPFSTGKKGKMPARMSKTFQRLTSVDEHEPTKLLENFSDPTASNEISSMEKQIETQKIREEKIQQALSNMSKSSSTGNDDSGSALGDYSAQPNIASRVPNTYFPPVPVAPPVNTSQSSTTPRDNLEGFTSGALSALGSMHSRTGSSYQQSYGPTQYSQELTAKQNNTPIYSRMNGSSSSGGSQQQLMEKLNYMIHLLEEQQKEPTQHILEEFLLYGLLGIFMIFLVDSFTRVGKYTR